MRTTALLLLASMCLPCLAAAQSGSRPAPATRAVYLDQQGVIRWQDNRQEVALYGANYTLPSASDYRAAGYLGHDRRKLVDQDMAHFARMGWDAVRVALWGDWEHSDRAGNLIANDHLDLADYLIARARERGIYILLSPIQTYNAGWPDALQDTTRPGFSRYFDRGQLGTNATAIAAQVNYLKQLLEHVNPYTGTALKNEPAILFIEPINEPWHHPEDLDGSVRYFNALVDAVRSTGCDKLIFHASCTSSIRPICAPATCIRPWRAPSVRSERSSRPCFRTTCSAPQRATSAGRPTTSTWFTPPARR
jgi:hypothetical protein